MDDSTVFLPSRLGGLLFLTGAFLLMGGLSAAAIYFAVQQDSPTYFVLFLLLAVALFAPLPFMLYRVYALLRATYTLERDGLRLRWGLRAEDIPLAEIEWVRLAQNLPVRLPLPRPSWPGAILGVTATDELGRVEFLASSRRNLLLVATPGRVFAISPQDPQAFLEAIQSAFELGSLSPFQPTSVLPAAYFSQVWSNSAARVVLAAGLLAALLLFVGVSLLISARQSASLGFYPGGAPLPPVPSIQLLLLPILAAAIYLIDLLAGMYFFRHPPYRPLAFLLWSSSLFTTLLFGLAAAFILAQPTL